MFSLRVFSSVEVSIKCVSDHSFTSHSLSHRYFGHRRQWDCRGASNLDELHQRLSRIMIRRLKAEVLTQLPPKIRQRIPFDLPKEAAKVGHAVDKNMFSLACETKNSSKTSRLRSSNKQTWLKNDSNVFSSSSK